MEPPGRHKADRRPGQATGGSLWPVGAHSLLQFSQPIRAGEIARSSFRLRSMAYSDDRIEHANLLVDLNVPNAPKQVDLRRAASAAYYAILPLVDLRSLPELGA